MSRQTEIRFIIFGARGGVIAPSQLSRAKFYNIELASPRGFNYRYKFDKPFPDYAKTVGQKRLFLQEEVDETIFMYEKRLEKQRKRYRETPQAREAMRRRRLADRKKEEELEKKEIEDKQKEILKDFPSTKRRYTDEYKLKEYYDAVMGAVRSDSFVFHKLIMEFKDPIGVIDANDPDVETMVTEIKRGFHVLLKRLYQTGKGQKRLQLKLLIRKFDTVGNLQGDILNPEQDYQGFSLPREGSPIDIYTATQRVDELIERFLERAFYFKGKHSSLFAEGFISLGGIMIIDIAYEPESRQEFYDLQMNPYTHSRKNAITVEGTIWENSSRLGLKERKILKKLNS